MTGFCGKMMWDTKTDGQPKRTLEVIKEEIKCGYVANSI